MDLKIRQGETLQIPVEVDDITASTVLFQAGNETGVLIDGPLIPFETINGKRIANIRLDETNLPVGEYDYMLTITYSDGVIDKIPDPNNCPNGDCGFAKLIICDGVIGG